MIQILALNISFPWLIAIIVGSGIVAYIFGDRVRAYLAKKAQYGLGELAKKL